MSEADSQSPTPAVTIRWNQGTLQHWQRLFDSVPRSTLPQTFAYAQAMAKCEKFLPRLGLIEADGRPVGLVQVLERTLLRVIRVVHIHRGPLWLEPRPAPEIQIAALAELRRTFPGGLTRWTSFLPELPAGAESNRLLAAAGFHRLAEPGYRTLWLDLAPPVPVLRAQLAGNWRNHLKQAERSGLTVEADSEARALPWLVERHLADKKARRYRGPSGPLVIRLRNALYRDGNVLLLRALAEGEPVAGILLLRHGDSATWLIGWSGAQGRRLGAHTLLLWQAVERLKAAGTRWFDLGGINPDHAPGVTVFKRGVRGEEVELAGRYV
jgi:hypothetical protein